MKKYIITLCLVVGLGTTIVGCRDYLDSDYIFDERMSIEQVFQSKDYTNEWLARGYTYLKHDYLQQVNSKKNTSFNFADDMYYGDLNYVDWKSGNYTEKSVRGTVDFIVRHPLIPSDVTVYGFIIDSTTGELTRIV